VIIVVMSPSLDEKFARHADATSKLMTFGSSIPGRSRTLARGKNMPDEDEEEELDESLTDEEFAEIQQQEDVDSQRKDFAQDLDMNS